MQLLFRHTFALWLEFGIPSELLALSGVLRLSIEPLTAFDIFDVSYFSLNRCVLYPCL